MTEQAQITELEIHEFFGRHSKTARVGKSIFDLMARVDALDPVGERGFRSMIGEYLMLARYSGALRLNDFDFVSRLRLFMRMAKAAVLRHCRAPVNLLRRLTMCSGIHPIPCKATGIRQIAVIVPVYDGYDSLRRLCATLFAHTPETDRILFVNDSSPDARIAPFLEGLSLTHGNVTVLTNEKNIGFPATVNRGVAACDTDFVLLNTDTEVPDGWIPRLFSPLWSDSRVASAMPLTCEWPNSGKWNPGAISMSDVKRLGVAAVDAAVRNETRLAGGWETKTNLGFCLAISREAWNRVGPFGAEVFGRGYHEETDWCARARYDFGYRHCIAGNVFVAHWHNGSFTSEQRKEQIKRNKCRLKSRNPVYEFDNDPICMRSFRFLMKVARRILSSV